MLDDELPGLTYLKLLLEQLPDVEVLKAYNNPEYFIKEASEMDFDICFMDIKMPGISGLQIAEFLKGKNIVFVTAYKEFASDAFDLNAVDYIKKPVTLKRLHQAVEKVRALLDKPLPVPDNPYVLINTDKGKTMLHFNNILYIKTSETDSRDKIAVNDNFKELVLKNISFKSLSDLLPEKDFVQINKKEMIALKIVVSYTFDTVTTALKDTRDRFIRFTLSEKFRKGFMKFIKQ